MDVTDDMSRSSSVFLTTVLKLMDRYDLYAQVAYPKHHKQIEVPDIYQLAAKTNVTISKASCISIEF
jgi:sucrose-phosphate synthase